MRSPTSSAADSLIDLSAPSGFDHLGDPLIALSIPMMAWKGNTMRLHIAPHAASRFRRKVQSHTVGLLRPSYSTVQLSPPPPLNESEHLLTKRNKINAPKIIEIQFGPCRVGPFSLIGRPLHRGGLSNKIRPCQWWVSETNGTNEGQYYRILNTNCRQSIQSMSIGKDNG